MAMQPPELPRGQSAEGESGTFEAHAASSSPASLGPVSVATRARFQEAHRLACEIERLLTPADPRGLEEEGYGPRLARALARSLIDQLADLNRPRVA